MTSKETRQSREAYLMQQYANEKRSGATDLSYQEWKEQRGIKKRSGLNLNIIRTILRSD